MSRICFKVIPREKKKELREGIDENEGKMSITVQVG